MNTAYLDTCRHRSGYTCDVVTWQDYHECGPFAHSHRTALYATKEHAEQAAKGWAEQHGYTVVSVDDIAY